MVSCLIIHILLSAEVNKKNKELESTARELWEYYFDHPYLELNPEIKKLFFGERYTEEIEEWLDSYRRKDPDEIHLFQEEEQEELDALSQRLKNTLDDIPYRKWGFIPAKKSFLTLLTYMFIHGGWLHLIGNLFFLYLTGPFIEDVWGRPIYTAFYLLMGVLSALMFAQQYPNLKGPLIGASGAIAGVMGAFLIRYWKTKIHFFYMFFIFIRGTFKAPAWLMLPLWLLLEYFNASIMDKINPEGGGGVAHWAHVGGFVCGAFVGVALKAFKVEEKYIHPKIEAQVSYVDEKFQALEEAMQKKRLGQLDEAYTLLLNAARKNPTHQETVEGLWEVALETGRQNESAEFLIMLIEREIRRNQMDNALSHFRSLKAHISQVSLSLTYKIMVMQHLAENKEFEEAKQLANELLGEVNLNSSPGLLLNFVKTASELDSSIAEKAIEICLQHPEIPADQKDKLKIKLDDFQKKSQTAPPVSNVEHVPTKTESQLLVEPSESERSLSSKQSIKITTAIPLDIKDGKIALNMGETGEKLIPLNSVQCMAVVEISSPQERPFLLIDLFLDDPKANTSSIRAIRLFSTSFDPKKFFPTIQNSHEALKAFISDLLKLSAATSYPDEDSVLLKTPKNFPSIEEYEKAILS